MTYLDTKSYWALVADEAPKLRPVEVGELTAYLNGTSRKLRESLRFGAKIIEAELKAMNTRSAERKAYGRARAKAYRVRTPAYADVRPPAYADVHPRTLAYASEEREGEKEILPPTPPIKEKGEEFNINNRKNLSNKMHYEFRLY